MLGTDYGSSALLQQVGCAGCRRPANDDPRPGAGPARRGQGISGDAMKAACDPDTIRELLAERDQLAAALVSAREDAERWRQAFVNERASRYRADGMKVEQARIHAETDAVVAAIDQARGKGVA